MSCVYAVLLCCGTELSLHLQDTRLRELCSQQELWQKLALARCGCCY